MKDAKALRRWPRGVEECCRAAAKARECYCGARRVLVVGSMLLSQRLPPEGVKPECSLASEGSKRLSRVSRRATISRCAVGW
jgi:hypothetical protein